ncbi:MAG: CvpA family protein [Planctomycetaceae bacterium]|nr:CvpA family protein [Planctomycetaceae bacterium]MBV8310675.1 CvpA family protein [Planctomycetaceae bacterium]
MGLDLALGVIILIAALRGWLKGFVSQAVRIAAFIACFYLADPLREQGRPYILGRMPAIDAGLLDRILWWVAVVVSYIVLVALITLAIQLTRTPPPPGAPKSRRDDQFGGLLLGTAKGLLVAVFLAAGVAKYGTEIARNVPWAERRTAGSYALKWTAQYQPAPRIWAAPPVRSFVEHIQRNGLKGQLETEAEKQVARQNPVDAEAAARLPRLDLTPAEALLPDAAPQALDLDPDLVNEIEGYKSDLHARGRRP